MEIFKTLVILLGLFTSVVGAAEQIIIDNVIVTCVPDIRCAGYQNVLQSAKGNTIDEIKTNSIFNKILLDKSVQTLEYSINSKSELAADLHIKISPKRIISKISYLGLDDIDITGIEKFMPIRETEYFDPFNLQKSEDVLKDFLELKGVNVQTVLQKLLVMSDQVEVLFEIEKSQKLEVKNIEIVSEDVGQIEEYHIRLSKYIGSNWDRVKFKVEVDSISDAIFKSGYFFSNVELIKVSEDSLGYIVPRIKIYFGEKAHFSFVGNVRFSRLELMDNVRLKMKKTLGKYKVEDLKKTIISLYEEIGLYGTEVDVRSVDGFTFYNVPFKNFYVSIQEGKKLLLREPSFEGFEKFNKNSLLKIFRDQATPLVDGGYFEKSYVEQFSTILKSEYQRQGFVRVEVEPPQISIDLISGYVDVSYLIRESSRTTISKFDLNGVAEDQKKKISDQLSNKLDGPFNPLEFQNDLKIILDSVRDQGSYFAKIGNISSSKLVTYSPDYSNCEINIELERLNRIYLDDLVISGTNKTKNSIIRNLINIKKGDLITPAALEDIRNEVIAMGLFSSVQITPVVNDSDIETDNKDQYTANLLIQVQELDSVVFELAPGYRTDLGVKLSADTVISNIDGLNRTLSFKTQVNQKLSLSELDPERVDSSENILEYSLKADYADPYLFDKKILFGSTISTDRERFYSFDADLWRISFRLSKFLTKKFGISMKYQLEYIEQYNASESKDEGIFRIGSLIPSLTYDFRDNPTIPKKGGLITLSIESANPAFLASDDLNFVRVLSRNRFYFPVTKNLVLAFSFSTGVIKNLNKIDGYVPQIKVFRLNGADVVRGFADNEINRLESGKDISEEVITDRAYFSNIKIEPRFNISDTSQIGVFYDGGRVFLNEYRPFDLKSAVGISFKYLTPVGSIDFDYGIKIKNSELLDGTQEEIGRFHLSIGYF